MLVTDSRSNTTDYIRRRRKCDICEEIFSTVEIKRERYDEFLKAAEDLEKLRTLVRGEDVNIEN